jgi:hypothetical protein
MDKNAFCMTISSPDTKHQISLEFGALGIKLADMTQIHVIYLIKKNLKVGRTLSHT